MACKLLIRMRYAVFLCLVGLLGLPTAEAEIVFFQSGRALCVKAVRSEGGRLVLQLRGGGVVTYSKELIVRVEPNEIQYPEDVEFAEASLVAPPPRDRREPPAIPERFRELVSSAAARHGVDPRIVHALIQVESADRSRAVLPKGARALMQLMPATVRQYGALNLLDPTVVNVEAGIRHLKMRRARFDLPLALAAYNAAEAAVERFGDIPPFKKTQNYVKRILRLLDQG
jgi:hypothetical protein